MRSKEEDIDYRFLVDPDLPIFKINQKRIEWIRENLSPVPFDLKYDMCQKYSLSVVDVNTIFLHPETICIFENLVETNQRDPKQVFRWLY